LITGSAHLRADPRKGIEIIRSLRGHTTGYAIPQFVIDAPGGGGKVPINPEYVKEFTDEAIVMRNFSGDEYSYPLVVTPDSVMDPNAPELETILA
jgi:lysine 2,3-aminomutase